MTCGKNATRPASGPSSIGVGRGAGEGARQGKRLAGVPFVGPGRLVEMKGELAVGFRGVGEAGLGSAFRAGKDILIALGGPFRQRHPRHPLHRLKPRITYQVSPNPLQRI
ncbi:hypothetical protein FE88_29090 [Azospirillum brasilense]|nr:hypothetical protein FE88_29090 [Azospirillum brasilense]